MSLALSAATPVHAQTTPQGPNEWLCDASYLNCRTPLIQLIQNENVGLDVAFWFMQDARYKTEIVKRWKAGVPVRVLVDPLANPSYPGNDQILIDLAAAGIPMRMRKSTAPGILHWKTMVFAGQGVVEFSGANYSPTAFVPQDPYVDYEDEVIYFSDDPSVVQSFMTEYDNHWVETTYYADYANITSPPVRMYPTFVKDGALNFPQAEDYATRLLKRFPKELRQIDVIMYRITDERETNALITAFQRGIPVRMISDTFEYRTPKRQWHSYNLDKLWAAGIPLKVRAHLGLNHQKLVLFHNNVPSVGPAGPLSVFGSSNWTTPSANQQQEHNYFTLKPWMFDWFLNMFDRKWNNTNPVGAIETDWFVPLPPDKPINMLPANAAVNLSTTGQSLKWDPGYFGQYYDIYLGLDPNPPLYKADLKLGPVDYDTPKTKKTFSLPTLVPGTTYYWRIVSKTMAGRVAAGPVWSFTTKGTPPPPPPPPPGAVTQVIWASDVPAANVFGLWKFSPDLTAAGNVVLWNTDKGKSKISPALAAPENYFEVTFTATAGVPYHMWVRMRAQANSLSSDAVSAQFNDSTDAFGSATYRIGTPTGAEFILQDGSSGSLSGWGWADNGFGNFGPDIYFATTGTHTLRIQQRSDGTIVDQIVLSPDTYARTSPGAGKNDATILGSTLSGTPPPSSNLFAPWQHQTVGVVGVNGNANYDPATATFSVIGGGGDVWGTADGMDYLYQPLTGDGSIVARVTGVQNANALSKAGVMIRETMAPGSANAYMCLSAGKTLAFERRLATAEATLGTSGGTTMVAPYWLRLDRTGDTFTAYASKDGNTWSYIGADTVVMTPNVYVGLAVTSATVNASSLGTFDNVATTPGTPAAPVSPPVHPPLPAGWAYQDIGAVGFTGDTTFDTLTSSFSVKGAGADIWGTADAFHFAYRAMTGDGFIVARVRTLQNINASAKAGVMIRGTLDAASPHAYMAVTPSKGTLFERRLTAAGASTSTTGTTNKAPYWVKLERIGDLFNAYQSADGVAWTLVGSDTVVMGATVYVGLAVTSHVATATATAAIDGVAGSW